MKKLTLIFAAFLLLINFAVEAQTVVPVKSITVNNLKQRIKTDSSLIILDVRTPAELEGPLGEIEGVVNIPVEQLENRIGELEKYKDREIAVICRAGHRSLKGTRILLSHGFRNVENVEGGMEVFRQK
jgi:rhodanese-related sulfurtransferase